MTAPSHGEVALFATIILEGLLLDTDEHAELSKRLQEAVAHTLARSDGERRELRRKIGKLYKVRSDFVHKATLNPEGFDPSDALDITARIVQNELRKML